MDGIIRKCKQKDRNSYNPQLLDELIATQLTEDLMDKFKINKKKRENLRRMQTEYATQIKIRNIKKQLAPIQAEVPRQYFVHKKMHLSAQKCPITEISKFQERCILKRIQAGELEKKFHVLVKEILVEVREQFTQITHDAGIHLKVKPLREEESARCNPEPYKFLGKTDRYNNYLVMRKRLDARWMLHYSLILKIQNEALTTLPITLLKIDNLRNKPYELSELDETFNHLVSEASSTLNKFYYRIVKLVQDDKTVLPPLEYDRYLKTCSGLLSKLIGHVVTGTINNIVQVVQSKNLVPYLKLMINYQGRLILRPTENELSILYSTFIVNCTGIASNFEDLVKLKKPDYPDKKLSLHIANEFIQKSISEIKEAIHELYIPILQYVNTLESNFSEIYEDIKTADFGEDEMSFQNGCRQILHYQSFIEKASDMTSCEYFAIGQLILSEYVKAMKESLSTVILSVFSQLCKQHIGEITEICNSFEMVSKVALQKPKSTAELIDQGKYMTYVKATLLVELTERIQESLYNLTKLIEFGTLSEEHMKAVAETVHWLQDINVVLDQYSTMYEQLKFEAEEFVQAMKREVFNGLDELVPKLAILDLMDDAERAPEYVIQMSEFMASLRNLKEKILWINSEEKVLGFPQTIFTLMKDIENIIYPFYHLLYLCKKIVRHIGVSLDGQFEFLVYEDTETFVEDTQKELLKIQKSYKVKIRQSQVENVVFRFSGILEDVDVLNIPSPLKLTTFGLKMLRDFRPVMTMMRIMCNDALMSRHWKDMSEIAGFDLTPNAGTSLRKMMQMGLEPQIDSYDVISSAATKERELLNNLRKMQAEWAEIFFKTSIFKDTGLYILTALDDIQVVLDDHILKALTMRGSIFVKPYETEVRAFYDKLLRVNSTLEEWGKVQSQWLYLLPIFSSKDIIAQMPEEANLFREVNDTFKRHIDTVLKEPRVLDSAGAEGVLESMQYCNDLLEQINDGVTNYLEKKRLYFARFFFLSNDEMLEILSETKDPLRVEPHLKKCFEAIHKLLFDDNLFVLAMYSQEGEQINLKNPINVKEAGGSVEKWLVQVEQQMVVCIRDQIIRSYKHYFLTSRTQWILKWPGQIVLAVSQMHWTLNIHKALNLEENFTIGKFLEILKVQLKDIVGLIRDPTLTNLSRITIKALIVIDVHAKDVVEDLYGNKISSDKEFKWMAQLRYYLEKDEAYVRLINATVKYAYEYLGNSDRLVITPLTDRCYRTLVGAFDLHLNGAPEGPAGTGKTETVKDLAKALAVQCVVFNCSDGLDYKAMGKFFKGLAASGAWVCFDEFNRIDIEVLSVVAQQILLVVMAVRAHVTSFNFEGTEINLNPMCYVCITMNPGYAGRTELPDNLKVLFRTVAMMVPDYALIGEISLYSYGFIDARNLSVKIVTVYRLCSEQLSSQNHYDYGMRAVKSVLSAAGNNKRKFPEENEDILLLRAILDVNLPKFLHQDLGLFDGIVSDLFPGVVLPEADYTVLTSAMLRCIKKRSLQPTDSFITKIIQTYEMMIVRHGFMIVGLPFAGKSSTLKVLADSLSLINNEGTGDEQAVQYHILNPKAVTMGQLYGQFDPISYEWFDGVAATIFRNFTIDQSPDRKWMIFDGPVDAVWIENMNSVLDDNKKLCLMSGEVMSMTNSMSLIFEVMDLEQASPATVSRCGMIYMEPASLGWIPFVQSWLPTCNKDWCGDRKNDIMDLFNWLVPPCLDFLRKYCTLYCNPGEITIVNNMMSMVEMLLDDACDGVIKKEEEYKNMNIWIQATFIQAGIWGLASLVDTASRKLFDEFYRQLWLGENVNYPYPVSLEKLELVIPVEGILCDYVYNYRMKGNWKYWPDVVRAQRVDECKNILRALIPTVDTARYMNLVEMHVRHQKQFLLVGPTGTGKSFYLQDLLMNQIDKNKYEPGFITFTIQITANQTQELVISKLNKMRRGHYGAPKGKFSVMFIDDVNMPAKEIYGAQPPLELLRQYFDHKNWYDLKTTSPLFLHNIFFIGAMGLVGGSRQEVYARFLRHFNIFSINEFSQETMSKIYSNILLLGWKNNGFPAEIFSTVQVVVNASLRIYEEATLNLRPTPSKSHYVFNLRDFSRLIQGCAMLKKESSEDKKIFARIWVHEVYRIFSDRLVENGDKEWLFGAVKQCVTKSFRENFELLFEDLATGDENTVTQDSILNLIFGTFFDQESDENRRYEEVKDIETFRELSLNCLEEYNSSHKTKMDIVLFDYALKHLSRICRVISMDCGSSLLVGISGSGRQSLTRLASVLYNFQLFQPEITNNYSLNDWREDIKKIVKEAGGRGRDCIFLITEGQIKEECFLQDVDCLLNSGEVPNIYQIDEKQEILDMVRLAAQGGNRNLDISALSIFFFFTKRCRDKLHIILCFSPVGTTFRNRLRLFPSLINCCTIDWFEDWPKSALEEVAVKWLENVSFSVEIKQKSVLACTHFHVTARQSSQEFFEATGRKTYITSASYLELIRSFASISERKQTELTLARNRYIGGLEKLFHAATQIGQMQVELGDLRPKLEEMNIKATQMLKRIEKETIIVEEASNLVKEDEKIANAQAAASQALKQECEADLAEALPILEEALRALDTLKPADITLVKSMKNPPAMIKLVMAAVCIIKGVKPDRIPEPGTGRMIQDYWGPSKRILGDINFLQSLKDFDKDNIPQEIMTKIRKEYISHKDFKPHIVAKASSAAEGLCKWLIAMDMYHDVNKIVKPKKMKLALAEEEFAKTMAILTEKRNQMMKLEAQLADLREKLDDAQKSQQQLQDNVDLCNAKLTRAQKLIGGLGGEKVRWTEVANSLKMEFDNLAGDVLISCGIICYLSPLNSGFRQKVVLDWQKYVKTAQIPCASEFDFIHVLGSDVTIQNWYIDGLPRDSFSTENGIIQNNSNRWSLLIDPQQQANQWIKRMEKRNSLHCVKFTYFDYMKTIQKCIQLGYPILIESIEEILEAPLDPLLFKTTFKQGGLMVITIAENVIEYNPNFKLYLTTKFRNPHYLPEVFNRVTIINFALTLEGLQDQLLGIVVAVEKPELQQLKEELIVQKAENKAALENTEELILKTLAESKGDILEDENAIQILDKSKLLSIEIMEKQTKSLEIEKSIEDFRMKYQPVSQHSAVLYYCISDLANVDPMYQYSLEWFINLYVSSIQRAERFRNIERRCNSLKNAFTYDLYSNITRSLFEKDKLLFSLLLCVKIMIARDELDPQDFLFLLTGGVTTEAPKENQIAWLPDGSWDEMCKVEQLNDFKGFVSSVVNNLRAWKSIYDNYDEGVHLPEPWNSKSPFSKLIVVRILRPDKLIGSITAFIRNTMDEKYIKPPQFDISVSYNDSYNVCPLIFILSPGTDPMTALVKFAEDMKMSEHFKSISLGQGQGPIAAAMIEEATEGGMWVCLQNCHLATSWMPSLEKIFESLEPSNTHNNFRLWLTSYPSPKFPISVLQRGVKMTNEPPQGLQNNLLKSYINNPVKNPDFYNGCPDHRSMFARLLYGLAFFHAVVQERRTFGPLGWNIPYGFNDSDFDISAQQLQIFINENDNPYEALTYLIGECNYGGRVTDDWDRRLIVTILENFINPSVSDDLRYSFSTVGKYYSLPEAPEHSIYLSHIQHLPAMHPPEVFGLHTNAGITRDMQNSRLLLGSVLKAYGETSAGGTGETDKIITIMCTDMLSKLPEIFNLEIATKKFPVEYSESMNTVLVQEMERFNKLLKVIIATLTTMLKAIQGLVAMSPPVEEFGNSLLLNQIPDIWDKVSYPSLKNLPNYMADFLQRIEFLQKWFNEGKPKTYWISGFFFTQAFLTGVKQNFARKYTIPIDKLTYDFAVLKDGKVSEVPADGANVYGLFTDGARWDRQNGMLAELYPKVLNDVMPLIWFQPIHESKYYEGRRYKCPVYKTSARRGVLSTTGHSTNYVVYILLETNLTSAHWIKRSVALLCQPD